MPATRITPQSPSLTRFRSSTLTVSTLFLLSFPMAGTAGFWQNYRRMQNADEAKSSPLSSDSQSATPLESPLSQTSPDAKPIEIGGPSGPEPTRYGDWEKKGRCIDF